jgi:N-formylglutamate amidohydrolase
MRRRGTTFDILAPYGPPAPIVGHVPHAGLRVPPAVRAGLLPDDATLEAEHLRLVDRHTDRLFDWLRGMGATLLVNRVSRLVVDPERFTDDDREPMAAVGQGAVYTRTTDGRPLREPDAAGRARLLARATEPLPSEPDRSGDRPDVCLGTDAFHTPPVLVERLGACLSAEGLRVAVDRPFAGSLVPRPWLGKDARVAAVMVEVRRGTYMDERTGDPLPSFDALAGRLERAVRAALAG